MEPSPRTVVLTAKITPELSERLDRLKDRMGISRSDLAFRCVRDGLDDLERLVPIAESRLGGTFFRILCGMISDPDERDEVMNELQRLRANRKAPSVPRLPYPPETS